MMRSKDRITRANAMDIIIVGGGSIIPRLAATLIGVFPPVRIHSLIFPSFLVVSVIKFRLVKSG